MIAAEILSIQPRVRPCGRGPGARGGGARPCGPEAGGRGVGGGGGGGEGERVEDRRARLHIRISASICHKTTS